MSNSQAGNGEKSKSITDQPLPASHKVYIHSYLHPEITVAMRAVALSGGHNGKGTTSAPPVMIYDTSGPYTDPTFKTDIRQGLRPLRLEWIKARGDVGELTAPSYQPTP